MTRIVPPQGHLFWAFLPPESRVIFGHADGDTALLRMDRQPRPDVLTILPRGSKSNSGGIQSEHDLTTKWGGVLSHEQLPHFDRVGEILCWCPRPFPNQRVPEPTQLRHAHCRCLDEVRGRLYKYLTDTDSVPKLRYALRRGAVLRWNDQRFVVLSSEHSNQFRQPRVRRRVVSAINFDASQALPASDDKQTITRHIIDANTVAYRDATGRELLRAYLDMLGTFVLDASRWIPDPEFADPNTNAKLRLSPVIMGLLTEDVVRYLGLSEQNKVEGL